MIHNFICENWYVIIVHVSFFQPKIKLSGKDWSGVKNVFFVFFTAVSFLLVVFSSGNGALYTFRKKKQIFEVRYLNMEVYCLCLGRFDGKKGLNVIYYIVIFWG